MMRSFVFVALQRGVFALQWGGFLLFAGFARLIGWRASAALGGFLARRFGRTLRAHARAARQLDLAYDGRLTAEEKEAVLSAMWDNLGRTIFEYPHVRRIVKPPARAIAFAFAPEAQKVMAERPCRAVFFSGHFANWELMPFALTAHNIPAVEIYRPQRNPFFTHWLRRMRTKHIAPFQLAKGREGARSMVRHIKEGRAFAMLLDQWDRRGLKARFFGREALTNDVLAVLHLRYGYQLIPAAIERTAKGFVIRAYPPLVLARSGDYAQDALALTQKANDFLEARVRENPAQWLWMQKRWGDDHYLARINAGSKAKARQ